MALVYNLDNNTFLKNRLQYHAASRVGISVNQALAQATNVDGHTVTDSQIWTAKNNEFPKNTGANKTTSDGVAATNDLVAVFKNGNQYQVTHILTSDSVFKESKQYFVKKVDKQTGVVTFEEATVAVDNVVDPDTYYEPVGVTGKIYRNDDFPAVELYEAVQMNDVEYSDKQAWQVKVAGSRIMDWIAPTSVMDNGVPVPGFSGIVQIYGSGTATVTSQRNKWTIIQKSAANSYAWQLKKGTWQFVSMSGMLIFHPDYLPSSLNYSKIRITGFKYVGSKLTDTVSGIDNKIADEISRIDGQISGEISRIDGQIAGLDSKITQGVEGGIQKTLALKPYSFTLAKMSIVKDGEGNETSVRTITVPAFVVRVQEKLKGWTIGDLQRTNEGTVISFDLTDQQLEAIEQSIFVAYAFVNKDGSSIDMLTEQAMPELEQVTE